MGRDWEQTFSTWAQSPSKTEKERCERVIAAIRAAVRESPQLQARKTLAFTQGSFRNRVNVRQDSDVDVGVMLYDYFLAQYPDGKNRDDFGHRKVDDYSFRRFKDELEAALVSQFGRAAVKRGNKAFDIRAGQAGVEADVVPVFEFREYWDNGTHRAGVALLPDDGSGRIENFPERLLDEWPLTPLHYENGKRKNDATKRRYRGLVRILKKVRIELEDNGHSVAAAVPGYLVECLVWNVPDECFALDTWEDRVQCVVAFLWRCTNEAAICQTWCEVDGIKYLFRPSQPWTREQAHAFVDAAWDHVGVKSQ